MTKRIYGRAMFGQGLPEDKTLCIERVQERGMNFAEFYQCKKKRGHGPKGEYCRIHDPAAVKARQEARTARFYAPFDHARRQAEELKQLRQIFERANIFHAEVHGTPHCFMRFGEPAFCAFGSILENVKKARGKA